MPTLEMVDWLSPETLVLSLVGELDARGCLDVLERLDGWLAVWPGLCLSLELSSVASVDLAATEDLFLSLVARRTGEGALSFVTPSAACQLVLKRLNIDYMSHLPAGPRLAWVTV